MAESEALEAAAAQAAATKQFLLTLVDRDVQLSEEGRRNSDQRPRLSEPEATFIVKWLASKRKLSRSFDVYLYHILRVLHESQIGIRTRAMKCLTQVIEADPSILRRKDVKDGVYSRLTDSSSSVREAALDLIGKYITARPELIPHYLHMISSRILDVGLSVRKRVIKILKEICERTPDNESVPDIFNQIARRVNDEEGIKKLVNETFHSLWFQHTRDRETGAILTKVMMITDVVGAALGLGKGDSNREPQEENLDCLQTVLRNLLKGAAVDKATVNAARQIVDTLFDNVLSLDTGKEEDSEQQDRLLVSLTTLLLIARVRPELMVLHAETLQPYLFMNLGKKRDQLILTQVIKILEKSIPLMDHPGDNFLCKIEEGLLRLVKAGGLVVVQAAIPALSAIIHKQRRRMIPVWNAFLNYYNILSQIKNTMAEEEGKLEAKKRGAAARSICVIGLLSRYFDFDADNKQSQSTGLPFKEEPKEEAEDDVGDGGDRTPEHVRLKPWAKKVFDLLMHFAWGSQGMGMLKDIGQRALSALGHFCARHSEYLMEVDLKKRYIFCLSKEAHVEAAWKIHVLENLDLFLEEEERKMSELSENWSVAKTQEESLKEMGDGQSGLGSTVIQLYLNQVMSAYFNANVSVRKCAAKVISTTINQGLVTPAPTIPTLISMSTDPIDDIRLKADKSLNEMSAKYGQVLFTNANKGVRQSFRLHAQIRKAREEEWERQIKDAAASDPARLAQLQAHYNPRAHAVRGLRLPPRPKGHPVSKALPSIPNNPVVVVVGSVSEPEVSTTSTESVLGTEMETLKYFFSMPSVFST